MIEKLISVPFFQLIRHKSVQNFIFLLIIQSSNILISLIVMPLLIQSIGVDQFGLVSLALSVILIANVFVGFGYNLSGPRDVALNQKDPKTLSAILSTVISSKLVLAVLAAISLLIAVKGFGFFPEYQVILIYSLLMLFSEATLPVWFFQGMEKMKLVSVANVFSKLLYLAGIVLFIQGPTDAKWVNFFFGGSALSINLLVLTYLNAELKVTVYFIGFINVVRSWKNNVYLFLSAMASHISVSGGLVVLSFFATANVLGMYSLAERVAMVLRLFPSIVVGAVFPNASKLFIDDKDSFFRFVSRVYKTTLIFSAGISLTVYLLAPFIIKILAGEHNMTTSVKFLQILAFVPFMATLNIANMVLMLVSDQRKILFNSSWAFCLYMLLASIGLTSWLGGQGLAISMLSTEFVIFILCSWLLHKNIPNIFNGFYKRAFSSHHTG
ncbi:oligosaccharide flippase family protein [Echinicola rosea]|uniref:Transporter n=1 Tax=Echinicola rosea TaxID=1807691 RepID=A0ABQ1UUR7_9BACT|nr:oligosaccharide flippase family protein [Echinicola rosea]GGF27626.1 transporter [Echinicola rosea]